MEVGLASWSWVVFAGISSGALVVCGKRWPLLGFTALVPLGAGMVSRSPVEVSMAAALAGMIATVPSVWTPTLRVLVVLAGASSATAWALAFALAAWLVRTLGTSFIVVALPTAAILTPLVPRIFGAPRWGSNPLACTQERWLVVVHTARLAGAGDLLTGALLALSSAVLCLAYSTRSVSMPLTAAVLIVAGTLAFGWLSLRRAQRPAAQRVRVAAVVADGPPPANGALTGLWPSESPDYRDVEATVARYHPHVALAAAQGARILVLPEVCVYLDEASRPRWLSAVHAWAAEHQVAIVAPYFNAALPRNELAIVDARGAVAEHEKQYPAPKLEPPRRRRLAVGPHSVSAAGQAHQLSTAICVDLDYGRTARSARRSGQLLAVPANDWFGGFEHMHHRTAVWGVVLAQVPVVRATGHGISAIFDRAGRVIAAQSSRHGPVVLVADVEWG